MKYTIHTLLACIGLSLCGCKDTTQNDDVVSQRYIHKYGYAVSKQDWDSQEYPGQVISHMRNGITITSTYENGVLQGPTTYTFPHSQTVEHFYLYNQGAKVKEIHYNSMGMPVQELVQLSPSRHAITMWYDTGSPMLTEEFIGNELLEGQYFTITNDLESRIEKGNGTRICHDALGTLLAKEEFYQGLISKKETLYASGSPESVAYYNQGALHGEKRTFAAGGEPLAIEEYINGKLHGNSTYFHNGNKYLEISYLYGQKNGLEKHYIDGHILTEEISWENNLQHGNTNLYADGNIEQRWFYAGDLVTKKKFDELNRLDEIISQISSDAPDMRR